MRQSVYAMVVLDAIHYSVREDGHVTKKAAYVAIGTGFDGMKEVLGIWLGAGDPPGTGLRCSVN